MNQTNNPEGVNIYGSGLVGKIEIDTTETRSYYLKDHLGNIRCVVNNDGTLLNAQDYFPYGETIRQFNNTRYMLTEKERDTETNYDYFGARYYNSKLGVWLQVDPLSEKYPNWSPYNYTLNNPIRLLDIDGNIPYDKVVGAYHGNIGKFSLNRFHPTLQIIRPHYGIDLSASEGTSIYSFASGKVAHIGKSSSWGNYIVVEHEDGYFSLYAHIRDGENNIAVSIGEPVGNGQLLGEVGMTGEASGPHLHMEVGNADNLYSFLSKKDRSAHRVDPMFIGDLEEFIKRKKNLSAQRTIFNNNSGLNRSKEFNKATADATRTNSSFQEYWDNYWSPANR